MIIYKNANMFCAGIKRNRHIIISLIVLSSVMGASGAERVKRMAAVYYSDGAVEMGKVSLPAGIRFKLTIPEGGSISTTDMITGEEVKYGKARLFDLSGLRELQFYPVREEMRRDWKFVGKTQYNEETAEADYSPAPKEYSGDPYPLRYLETAVEFGSGETISGHLYSVTLYLEMEPGAGSGEDDFLAMRQRRVVKKLLLTSKQRGEKKTGLKDLVYIERIRFLDAGRDFGAEVRIMAQGEAVTKENMLQAVTRETLTPAPTIWDDQTGGFVVRASLGEPFYLAMKADDCYVVGWPEKSDPELMKLAKDHLERQRDFYNDKKLLGAIWLEEGKEVLTLVNLRRRHAETNFGEIGGEWDKEVGGIVEPWRLSLWRWKYDSRNKEMILTGRGTFYRKILLPEEPTPEVVTTPALWALPYDEQNHTVRFDSEALFKSIQVKMKGDR